MTRMSAEEVAARLDGLPGWRLEKDGQGDWLVKRLIFKGFAKPVLHANLAAFVGDQMGHHPDVRFGWGYCELRFTTHDAGGLTALDFDGAARFDAICAG